MEKGMLLACVRVGLHVFFLGGDWGRWEQKTVLKKKE